MQYPRVLIINGEPLHNKSATGLTMCSLFKDWPLDRLAQISTGSLSPDLSVCPRHMRLSPADLKLPQALRRNLAKRIQVLYSESSLPSPPTVGVQKVKQRSLFRVFKNHAAQFLYLREYDLSETTRKWISDFKPDIIYTMLYEINVMTLVLQVSELMDIPIIPHFMDDWPATLHLKYPVRTLLHWHSNRLLSRILDRSRLCLTISEMMADAYQQRYKKQCKSVMLCVDQDTIYSPPKTRQAEVVFTYIGGLHLKRWESLLEIRAALMEAQKAGCQVRCNIYTHKHDVERYKHVLHLPPVMTVEGTLCHDEVEAIQRESDCLIYIESFARWQKLFTRYSISSKIPEYLSVGRPVLVYGPEGIASIEQLRSYKCGEIVTSRNKDDLARAIINISNSPELREKYGKNALAACFSYHEASTQRENFRKYIVMGTGT